MMVFEKIKNLFNDAAVAYSVIEHEPVYTSQDAAKIRDTDISMGAKALVLFADKSPILVVVPGDKKIDFKKFKREFDVKDLRMATKEEVLELTGLEVGAIPPVGKAMELVSYFDEGFKQKEKVAFNAGLHTTSIITTPNGLIKVEDPVFGNFI